MFKVQSFNRELQNQIPKLETLNPEPGTIFLITTQLLLSFR